MLAGENLKTATKKRAKQALGLPSQDSPQSGAGKKRYKKESTTKKKQFASRQEKENISGARETRRQISLLEVKMAFVHHDRRVHEVRTRSLYYSGYTNVYHPGEMD